jgi:hypothetical protein
MDAECGARGEYEARERRVAMIAAGVRVKIDRGFGRATKPNRVQPSSSHKSDRY